MNAAGAAADDECEYGMEWPIKKKKKTINSKEEERATTQKLKINLFLSALNCPGEYKERMPM
jgi:hypothetical protein